MTARPLQPRHLGGRVAQPCVIVAISALAGCSYVPDWANPVAWYDSAFGAPGPAGSTAVEAPVPGADQDYPTLGSVPEPPEPTTGRAERQRLVAELRADLEDVRRRQPGQQRGEGEEQ